MDINSNKNLLQHVVNVFKSSNNSKSNNYNSNDFQSNNKWKNIQGGTFITAYKNKPFSSANVWCCMSNGNYNDGNVFDNSIESANICNTRDSRRTSEKPKFFEISILVPRYRWRKIPIALANNLLHHNRKRTIAIVGKTNNKMAIYLNSVWNERPQWSAIDLINNLKEKAGISLNEQFINKKFINDQFTIYEIDCYTIFDDGRFENHGFFNNIDYNTILKILKNIYNFYEHFKNPSTKQLAYLINVDKKNLQIKYDNDGANIRTVYDIITYHKVSTIVNNFGNLINNKILNNKIVNNTIPNTIPKTPTYAYADLLLEIYGTTKEDEICQLTKTANNLSYKDFEFEKPQQLLSLLNVIGDLGSCDDIQHDIVLETIDDFFNFYLEDLKISSFGANWITQALSKALLVMDSFTIQNQKIQKQKIQKIQKIQNHIIEKLVPILKDAFYKKESITHEATAAHGLLSIPWNILSTNEINIFIERWNHLQQQWTNTDNIHGGFRYYENESWYRTDVTSHIAEVLLTILNKDFTSS